MRAGVEQPQSGCDHLSCPESAGSSVVGLKLTIAETDQPTLYDLLARAQPSPVVELNRAVAVAMRDGPLTGLRLIDAILARDDLADYHLAHSARADLCRRVGELAEARTSYE